MYVLYCWTSLVMETRSCRQRLQGALRVCLGLIECHMVFQLQLDYISKIRVQRASDLRFEDKSLNSSALFALENWESKFEILIKQCYLYLLSQAIAKDAVLLRCKVIVEPYDCGGPILLEVFQIGTGGLNGMGYIVMTCRNLSRISIMNFREQVNMCVISLSLIYD
ncbi:isoamylase 3, chloroplastic [Trifolium repens]|nr:isoamylase 3, chloroplastic [Trifolium repens]